jgi:2',3'-cyclic-nucleotide 2'-phosphodiesterase (5'-nucleotidase family)
VESRIVEANGVKVGLFGLTIDIAKPEYVLSFREPVEEARRLSGDLRRQGAEVVVAVTHLTLDQDKGILDILGDEGPDLIIGGHEHKRQSYKRGRHRVIKADADAVSAAIVRITLKWDPDRLKWVPQASEEPTYRDLGGDRPPPDEEVNRAVQEWNDRFDMEFCLPRGNPVNCLDEEIGRTEVTLVAEEEQIRSCETNFGNWIADKALAAFTDQKAQGAIINAGSLRLNQNIPQGPILRRDLEELIQYDNKLRLIEVNGTTLRDIARNAIDGWPGNGRWLQVSGLLFHVDPRNPFGSRLELRDQNGSSREIKPDEKVRIVVTDFMLDEKGNQDGYKMLRATQVVAESPDKKLMDILREALKPSKEPGSNGINPGRTGSIHFVPGVETPCEG